MSTATLTRPRRTYAAPDTGREAAPARRVLKEDGAPKPSRPRKPSAKNEPPPLVQKVGLAAQVYGLQSFVGTVVWLKGWSEWLYPPNGGPNYVKAYEARPMMPVRIFFPATHDLTSPQTLPTVLTIHGGGFCVGMSRDDDAWNRAFANSQNMLVISLPYSKAPKTPFPGPLEDLEALYLAVLADESLPIDRAGSRTTQQGRGKVALLGFDAGGNLALALSQRAKVRQCPTPPTAAVSIAGYLDLERPVADKLRNRPYKPALASAPRNATLDLLAAAYQAHVWSYVPYGHDLRDPMLSPAFAAGKEDGLLPPHVCLVGAELDMLAHESWRLACRLVGGRWRVPDPDSKDTIHRLCGREKPSEGGILELGDEGDGDGLDAGKRFGFEVRWSRNGGGSVKWILVPDVVHGFDRRMWSGGMGGPDAVRDAAAKTGAYVDAVGKWLRETAWR